MGTYLNPGKDNYQMAVNSKIFVDKSEMILYLNTLVNTQQRFVSVSRPRRFGKTMAADMICAYYDREADSRGLFIKRKLAGYEPSRSGERILSWDEYLGKFDVVRLVITEFMEDCNTVQDMISYLNEELTGELLDENPDITVGNRINLRTVMNKIYRKTKRQFVIVIDEWDAIFRSWKNDTDGQTQYLDFLRDWLKDKPYVALAYMTGILPIKKYGKHSALNMFTEYSMTSPKNLAKYVGFTDDEVRIICEDRKLNYSAMKDWYDGYRISTEPSEELESEKQPGESQEVFEIYSPLSVVNAALFRRLENYWNKTETYEALSDYIQKDFDGLKEAVTFLMDGGRLIIDTSTYQNDMTTFHGRDDVLSLLIHLGYLGFDDQRREVFIPNREILDEFKSSTKGAEWKPVFRSLHQSQEILKATWNKEADKVADLLEESHNRAGNKTYNDEAALSYAVQLAYYAAQMYYTTILELDSGKGYVDIAYLPAPNYSTLPALLVELKYNKNVETAMSQIKRQKYPERLAHYKGNILLVAVDYERNVPNTSPEFKHHTCMIEEA